MEKIRLYWKMYPLNGVQRIFYKLRNKPLIYIILYVEAIKNCIALAWQPAWDTSRSTLGVGEPQKVFQQVLSPTDVLAVNRVNGFEPSP